MHRKVYIGNFQSYLIRTAKGSLYARKTGLIISVKGSAALGLRNPSGDLLARSISKVLFIGY